MDPETQKTITWIVVTLLGSIATTGTVVYGIYKSGRLLPAELRAAYMANRKQKLDNEEKEIHLAAELEIMLQAKIKDAQTWQKQFDDLQAEMRDLRAAHAHTKDELLNAKKNDVQNREDIRVLTQKVVDLEALSKSQIVEITNLTCEVNNYSLWTNALVQQLERALLKPVRMEEVAGVDCSKVKNDGRK